MVTTTFDIQGPPDTSVYPVVGLITWASDPIDVPFSYSIFGAPPITNSQYLESGSHTVTVVGATADGTPLEPSDKPFEVPTCSPQTPEFSTIGIVLAIVVVVAVVLFVRKKK